MKPDPAPIEPIEDALARAIQDFAAGRLREADTACRLILAIDPKFPPALHLLGNIAYRVGQFSAAAELIGKAVTLKPDANYFGDLGLALAAMKKPDEAIAAYRQAIAIDPTRPDLLNNLGNALKDVGRIAEAIDCCREAIHLDPKNPMIHSSLCYKIHFDPDYDPEKIARELSLWEERHGKPLAKSIGPHKNDPSPDRRLRIGYVSPDFYGQAETFFVLPLLESHDRNHFETHCYSSVRRPDKATDWLKKAAHVWHDCLDLSDEALAEQIRADGIDILVDLTMHMAFNRLPTFARKPAPVQVTWLAYPGGTGLSAIDYRFTDSHIDPPKLEDFYAEKSIRLPDSWCCYHPLGQDSPAIARKEGPIRFGSLNNPCKINELTLALWAGVLNGIDDSQLLMLVASEEQRKHIAGFFEQNNIPGSRLEFVTYQKRGDYLRIYDRIDIALDPLPYNGITTTCDALWMGVPVITQIGKTAAGRAGAGLLSAVGLPELIARSGDEFAEIAARLADNPGRLANLRTQLRGQMENSSLMNARQFARNAESAYRKMWQKWCENRDI